MTGPEHYREAERIITAVSAGSWTRRPWTATNC